MKSHTYEVGDVIYINHKETEVVARVAGFVLDNTKLLYVNLRIADGKMWGQRQIKIQPSQIVRADPDWYQRQHDAWEESIKATADAMYSKMTPAQKQRLHEETKQRRSPLDIMIDRACGIE